MDYVANSKHRVLIVVAGGLRDPGGVTRCMEYLIEFLARGPEAAGPPDCRSARRRQHPEVAAALAESPGDRLPGGSRRPPDDRPRQHVRVWQHASEAADRLSRADAGAHAIIHLHGAEVKAMFEHWPGWLRRVFRRTISQADRIVVLGRSWEEFLCRDVGISGDKVVTIPNAVPVPGVAREVTPGRRCRLLFLGRLEERKGVGRFLQALRLLERENLDYDAVMAGDGEVEFYRGMAARLGVSDRVQFTGWLDRVAVTDLMHSSDVLVLPSLNEGLPMAILEGMANETRRGGDTRRRDHRCNSGDNVTGLLVPPGDAPALASALRRVIMDSELRQRLGREARALAQAEFDVVAYGGRFIRLYNEVLGV